MKKIISIINADNVVGQLLINQLKKDDFYIVALTKHGEVRNADEIVLDWDISLLTLDRVIKSEYVIYIGTHFSAFKFLHSYNNEMKALDWLLKALSNSEVKKIINITYKGGYITSDNLYLQAKGIIEKKLYETKIPVLQFNTQFIINSKSNPTLDEKYFIAHNHKIEIIGNGKQIIYAIGCFDLVKVIEKGISNNAVGSYDVFSDILELSTLVKIINHFKPIKIKRIPGFVAYLKAYIDETYSPTQIDLFLRPMIIMYNERVKKDFNIEFQSIVHGIHIENVSTETKHNISIRIKRLSTDQLNLSVHH